MNATQAIAAGGGSAPPRTAQGQLESIARRQSVHWSAYEIFSVISGIALIALAFDAAGKTSTRMWCGIGGVGFIVYAIYVANQTTGTYYFPVWIFIIPGLAVLQLVRSLVSRRANNASPPGSSGRGSGQKILPTSDQDQ